MRISDWSSDVCSSDLIAAVRDGGGEVSEAVEQPVHTLRSLLHLAQLDDRLVDRLHVRLKGGPSRRIERQKVQLVRLGGEHHRLVGDLALDLGVERLGGLDEVRSEEHTSELQSLMRISYAVFCLTKKKQ